MKTLGDSKPILYAHYFASVNTWPPAMVDRQKVELLCDRFNKMFGRLNFN